MKKVITLIKVNRKVNINLPETMEGNFNDGRFNYNLTKYGDCEYCLSKQIGFRMLPLCEFTIYKSKISITGTFGDYRKI